MASLYIGTTSGAIAAVPLWRRNLRHFNRKIDLLSQIDLSELSPINGASQLHYYYYYIVVLVLSENLFRLTLNGATTLLGSIHKPWLTAIELELLHYV